MNRIDDRYQQTAITLICMILTSQYFNNFASMPLNINEDKYQSSQYFNNQLNNDEGTLLSNNSMFSNEGVKIEELDEDVKIETMKMDFKN